MIILENLIFITLDLVMQTPGGPQEDTKGVFKDCGWTFGYGYNFVEIMNIQIGLNLIITGS